MQRMQDPEFYVGQIMLFAGNQAPIGWLPCDGQVLPIASYTALFSVIGTTFGGDGRRTFGLPDLRGRVPLGAGKGDKLSGYELGELGGEETVKLEPHQMPEHSHRVRASSERTNTTSPSDTVPAFGGAYIERANTFMKSDMIESVGADAPIDIRQPYLALNYYISYEGNYPAIP